MLKRQHAWELAGAQPERIHIRELAEKPDRLGDASILTIPGGFSYGDDISAGKILAGQLVHYLADAIHEFVSAGKLVLGICNGFQVLVKAGLLPGNADGTSGADPAARTQRVTLTQNDSAKFEDRWVHLLSTGKASAFLPEGKILAMPIAHAEGKLVAADDTVRQDLLQQGHIALTYCDEKGQPGGYPDQPERQRAAHCRPDRPHWTDSRPDAAPGKTRPSNAPPPVDAPAGRKTGWTHPL